MSSSKKVKAICDKKSKDPSRHLRPRLDQRQDIQNQLRELRRWAKKMVYKIHQEYVDNESGIKGRGQRQQFTQMFQRCSTKKIRPRAILGTRPFHREGLQRHLLPATALQPQRQIPTATPKNRELVLDISVPYKKSSLSQLKINHVPIIIKINLLDIFF
ncbi:recombinase family protein [candidate division KSB1 bacterium]|nr:recombinase family protein [candidate division KSB1 bacterium]